ncbi:uncharacterized protein LOC126560841 [Anopheles maculipalpis]|uniref:uncharacterized protein LOC126560841 n=1 Tax=Anopheles maculipalpis TaxID=1496333 RepID=UPI002158EFE8|nr:uncharacterized protein LOC126560841 [Anopheles maculipalpis]
MHSRLAKVFILASTHHLSKYVIIVNADSQMYRTLEYIEYYFDHIRVMQYIVVIHSEEYGTVLDVGYFKTKRFIQLNDTVDFGSIYNDRLKELKLRAIISASKPYSYVTNDWKLEGLDIEIAEVVVGMLGIPLSLTLVDALNVQEKQDLLYYHKTDMYLTRRGCNSKFPFPQAELQERLSVRLMMPTEAKINFNLQFLKPYKREVWYLLLFLLIVACTLNWIFRQRIPVNVIMVIAFGYFQTTNSLTALLVVVIQFLKFILLETYLGQVTSFMIRLRFQENPQTLDEFFDSTIQLNAPETMKTFIGHLPTSLSSRLLKKLRQDFPFNETTGYEPGFAYIVTDYASDMMQNAASYDSMFNSTFFYIMKEPVYEFRMCYAFSMWSKFAGKYKECLQRLYETGIILKLTNEAWRFATRSLKANSSSVLMFPDLVPVFLFLCYGWALSVVCFAGEIILKLGRTIMITLAI